MSKKHNVKKQSKNPRYREKLEQGLVDGRLADPILSDGKRASAKR